MIDKNLTELEWKKFSKGKGFKDGAFVKALAALELGKTPEAKLAALDEIEKQADMLRKAAKADKELGSYLDDTDKAAGKERKLVEAEVKKAAAQQSASEEDEDSPALLTTKMIPLLRQVRKGEAMKTMIAITGKEVAVMVSRKPIGPPRRKLLSDYLGANGGVKFAVGEVIWEENANTFVLQTQAGGLAKKIKAALHKQTEQRLKVRVRGEDPSDIDDDGEPAEQEAGEAETGEAGTTAQQPQQPSTIPPAPPLPPTGGPVPKQEAAPLSDEALAFNTRLAGLMPQVKDTIAAAGPNATDVKLKISEAGVFARKREFAQANALLDDAERLLRAGTAPAAAGPAAAFNARLAALLPKVKEALAAVGPQAATLKQKVGEAGLAARDKQFDAAHALLDEAERLMAPARPRGSVAGVSFNTARITWSETRQRVEQQLKQLADSILQAYEGDPDQEDVAAGIHRLNHVMTGLDTSLLDTLDEALNAEPERRQALQDKALAVIARYQNFVDTDALMQDIDDNGFIKLDIAANVRTKLADMAAALR